MSAAIKHEPGVYFGMPEDEYLADPALGSTDLKALGRSPCDWWWHSPNNPLAPKLLLADSESARRRIEGKAFGNALHVMLLEGEREYSDRYYVMPPAPENAIATVDDIRAALDAAGVDYKKSLRKAELATILKSHFPEACILDDWTAEQKRRCGDRRIIPDHWDVTIRLMREIVRAHPQLGAGFQGGASEVSVFFEADGIRQRARFDKVKPQGRFDLKSISNWRGDSYRRACVREIGFRGYDVQAAHYIEANAHMVAHIKAGRVFGDPPAGLIDEILKADDFMFVFVFIQTLGSPRLLPIHFKQGSTAHQGGEYMRKTALANYSQYVERFGLAEMWLDVEPLWTPDAEEWADIFWRN